MSFVTPCPPKASSFKIVFPDDDDQAGGRGQASGASMTRHREGWPRMLRRGCLGRQPHDSRPGHASGFAPATRRYTEASLAELAPIVGVSQPESVPNLTRRFAELIRTDPECVATWTGSNRR